MRSIVAVVSFFAFMSSAFAQPTSVSAECRFREHGKEAVRCGASFEFQAFQSDSPSNLRVTCSRFGESATLVNDSRAELSSRGDLTVIQPRGPKELPAIAIPNTTITCLEPLIDTVEAELELPEHPFQNAVLRGECTVATVCGH